MPQHDGDSIIGALKIALIYLCAGFLWIYLSDRLVVSIASDVTELSRIETSKGWFFVSVTALLLWVLVYRFLHARDLQFQQFYEEMKRRKQLEASLKTAETMLGRTGAVANIGRWWFDVESMSGGWSDEVARMHDFPLGVPSTVEEGLSVYSGADRKRIEAALHDAIAWGKTYELELQMTTHLGHVKWVRTMGIPIISDGKTVRVEGVMQDISAEKNTALALKRNEALLHTIVESSPDAIFVKDTEGVYLLFNHGAATLVGKAAQEVLGRGDEAIFESVTAARLRELDRDVIDGGAVTSYEEKLTTALGETKYFWVTKGPLFDDAGKTQGLFGISRDITERKHYEMQLLEAKKRFESLAHLDTLTQLPNRLSLIERLEVLCASGEPYALMVLDLDNFKHINDSYGHRFGDRLLVNVAKTLRKLFGADEFLVRTGGDEFALVLHAQEAPLHGRIGTLQTALNMPFSIEKNDVYVSASIGIARFPVDAADAQTLLQNADAAMFDAKQRGKNTYSFYDPSFTERAVENTTVATKLKIALSEGALRLHYQPQIDPRSGAMVGVEALLRWEGEAGMTPARFIPIAEETGLIHELGAFVIRQSAMDALRLQASGTFFGRVAFNVSARQLMHPDFLTTLDTIVLACGARPELLELEITESVVLAQPEQAIALLLQIRARGYAISLDDFGTGYSSLSYVTRLPIDKLKIDRAFILRVVDDIKGQAVVATIISLARALEIKVLAEGVEREAELELLRSSGIDAIQGYLYHRPMPLEALEALI